MNSATTHNLRDQPDDAADRASQRIGDAANATSAAVKGATQKVSSAMGDFSERASSASKDLSRRVEQQPLTSVLVAAGAGFVVGMLMGRR